MYKNIVPGLITFDTELNHLPEFIYSEQFDFYPQVRTPSKYHYKLDIDNNIHVPQLYKFRNGYIIKSGDTWYYNRNLKLFDLKFSYQEKNKNLRFNRIYSYFPVEIGHIYPVGRNLRDLIDLELFLDGIITLVGGFSINYEGQISTIVGPSMNGKTTFLKSAIEKGGCYISEGPVIINLKDKSVYPCSNIERHGRKEGRLLYGLIKKLPTKMVNKVKIDKLYFITNSTDPSFTDINKDIFDFILFRSLFFLKNPFVSSFIYKKKLMGKILKRMNEFKNIKDINCEFLHIKNYSFDHILKNNGRP